MEEIVLRYEIPKNFKVSTNKIYAGVHWTKRKKIADYYHSITSEDCSKLEPITKKVDLHFKFYFKSRYLDSSNCSYMAKMFEDSLVKNGLIKNDTNDLIGIVSFESIRIPPKERKQMTEDYVRIIIKENKKDME